MSSSGLILVLIGQIGAGKSEVCRRLTAMSGARHVTVEQLRRNRDATPCPSIIAEDIIASARGAPVAFECTGASRDFEDIIEALRARGFRSYVVFLQCGIDTARRRRHQRPWTAPAPGGTWERQMQGTESRMRLVPADLTLSSERLTASALASTIRGAWENRASHARPTTPNLPAEFSFSHLSCFQVCPLTYRFKYVDRVPEPAESEAMFLGSRLHETLAWMYATPAANPTQADTLAWFEARLSSTLPPHTHPSTVEHLQTTGRKALAFHYEAVFLNERKRTIAVEHPLRMDLGGGLKFIGRADRVTLDPSGTVEVVDYKLSDGQSTSRPRVPDWLQSAAYAAAILRELRHTSVIARRTLLQTGEEQRFALSEDDTRAVSLALRRWFHRVNTSDAYPPNPGPHCGS
ncbi:MAG: hypothetical protein F4169_12470, partial [Gammaproteobacteria bacterium]|nr:hypothetical protein [Gammaproteobacteria bacterium]